MNLDESYRLGATLHKARRAYYKMAKFFHPACATVKNQSVRVGTCGALDEE